MPRRESVAYLVTLRVYTWNCIFFVRFSNSFYIMFYSFFWEMMEYFFCTWSMNISKYDWYIFIKSIFFCGVLLEGSIRFCTAEHTLFVKRNGFRYEIIVVEMCSIEIKKRKILHKSIIFQNQSLSM